MIKRIRNLVLYIAIFLVVGEILVRIDINFNVLNSSPIKIDTKIEETALKREIDDASFVLDSNQLRIMVVGDSYIFGGGINQDLKFSKRLERILDSSLIFSTKIHVLDISRPSNNTIDNYNSYIHYQPKFKPHIVVWAYNFNDILGGIQLNSISKDSKKVIKEKPPKRLPKKSSGLKKLVNLLYRHSQLARYLSNNLQKELKLKGIIIPAGDFYYLTEKAYSKSSKDWIETKKIFTSISNNYLGNSSKLILYNMPEFNLLEKRDLFSNIDSSLIDISINNNIIIKNGWDDFELKNGDEFMISRYDGHPNVNAHEMIAQEISELIQKLTDSEDF